MQSAWHKIGFCSPQRSKRILLNSVELHLVFSGLKCKNTLHNRAALLFFLVSLLQHLTSISFPVFLTTYHWPVDVPEGPLLAVQDLSICLVLLPVNPGKKGVTYIHNTYLKYQVKHNDSGPVI